MAAFGPSRRAVDDLKTIGRYTLSTWGPNQASCYLDELGACFQTLADNPALGRRCDEIRPGLHRFEHARHVVFYRPNAYGILVSRILHERMVPTRPRFTE